jgi:hypothetical protein
MAQSIDLQCRACGRTLCPECGEHADDCEHGLTPSPGLERRLALLSHRARAVIASRQNRNGQ